MHSLPDHDVYAITYANDGNEFVSLVDVLHTIHDYALYTYARDTPRLTALGGTQGHDMYCIIIGSNGVYSSVCALLDHVYLRMHLYVCIYAY